VYSGCTSQAKQISRLPVCSRIASEQEFHSCSSFSRKRESIFINYCHVLKKVDTFPFNLLPLPEWKEARRATGVPVMAKPILIPMPPIDVLEMASDK